MEQKITLLRTNLERFAIYRILKSIHECVVDWLELCRVFPIVLGFIGWLGFAIAFFASGKFLAGAVTLIIYLTYWLHIILFEED